MFLTILFSFFSSFWECTPPSALSSYLDSEVVVDCEVLSYHFEDEKLVLKVNVNETYRQKGVNVGFILYDHPNAYSEYKAGVTWMENMLNKRYIFYLKKVDGVYVTDVCTRIIKNKGNSISKETELIQEFENNGFDSFWVDNAELDARLKAVPITNVDSLLSTLSFDYSSYKGHPVTVTNFKVNKFGQLVGASSVATNRFEVSDHNELLIQPLSKKESRELSLLAEQASSLIKVWQPAKIDGQPINSVIKIRWELLTESKELTYQLF